jgi:protocadherin Fat 1/2/3
MIPISDVNDEAPKFSNPYYSVNVPEDSSVGIIIGKVTATDADLGVNRKVRYSLSSNVEEFEIDDKTGIMRLAKALDREIQAFYNLTIKAYDSGASQLYSTANFMVSVMDINDNAPEFEMQAYNALVAENALIGAEVLKVFATSKDTGINAEIKYQILTGNENGTFSIHSKSGIITVAKALDYETVKEYFITVKAEDGGIPPLSSEVHVTIRLSDINDVSPQFVQRSYDIVIREDATIGDRIIQIVAIDLDSSENANLTYSFTGGSLTYKEFQIDPISGIITVAKSLDREMISSYILEAVCSDNGVPDSLSSSVLVNIEISDFNDNPPLFEKTNYTIYVQEGRPVGYSLINFNIQDADSAANSGPFTFKLLSPHSDDSFVLVNEDASLRTNSVFNHSVKSTYSLSIQVTDSGTPPLHSSAFVHVFITQEPQLAPQFSSLSITVNSLEQFPGGIIGQVIATDEDPFDKLSYSITDESDKHLFSIDSTDGTLVAFPGLDAGKYKINVTVTDGKYITHGFVELEVIMITDVMVDNSIVVELRSISVKEFVTNYKKTFIRVMKNVFNVRMKDIIILSVQPAEHKITSNRMRRNENSLGDISVLFAVAKTRGGYFSRQWLKAKLIESKSGIEKQLGILMEDFIMKSECQHIACKHGECRDELILSESDVISIIGNKLSFVSPFHEHRFGCACHPGINFSKLIFQLILIIINYNFIIEYRFRFWRKIL